MNRVLILCALAVTIGTAAPSAAQADPIAIFQYSNTVHWVARQTGQIQSKTRLPTGFAYGSIANGTGDGTVLTCAQRWVPSTVTALFRVAPSGVTTLSTFNVNRAIHAFELDDAGDVIVVFHPRGAVPAALALMPLSGSTLVPLATWPRPLVVPEGFATHHASGDLFASDGAAVYRIDALSSVITSLIQLPYQSTNVHRGIVSDPHSRDLLIATGPTVLRLDPIAMRVSTFHQVLRTTDSITDIAFDQRTRGYLFSGYRGLIQSAGVYGLLDSIGRERFIASRPVAWVDQIRPTWGRAFTPLGPPVRGRTYRLRACAYDERGQAYQAGLSFAHFPGIATSAGVVPLAVDPMLVLSVAGAPIFRGFSGRLDATGNATIEIDVPRPAVLQRLRLHIALVTFGNGRIRGIRGPHSFTIR